MESLRIVLRSLLVLVIAGARAGTTPYDCGGGSIKYDTTCTTDCSQYEPRVTGDAETFNCSIGLKKDVDIFLEHNRMKAAILDPPKMIGVRFFRKPSSNFVTTPSLEINFLLPKALPDPFKNGFIFADAILMKFQAINDTVVRDEFYYHCPRERIFRFIDYAPKVMYDTYNPRNITFDCFVGLDSTAMRRVYLITLQSFPGRSIVYSVTVYVQSNQSYLIAWKPAIVTHFNENDQSINTVFEKAPRNFTVREYIVQLIKLGHGPVEGKKLNPTDNSVTFFSIRKGIYQVQISVDGSLGSITGVFMNATSYDIDASHLPDDQGDDYPIHYLDGKMGMWKVVAMVMGCIGGALLILCLSYFIWQRRKERISTQVPIAMGIVLHPFKPSTDKEQYRVVEKFKQFLKEDCQCSLLPTPVGDASKITNVIEQTSFVIVIYTSDCYKDNSVPLDYFSCALKVAVIRRKERNDLRIIPITFPFNSRHTLPDIISDIGTFNLMADIEKIYCKIHGISQVPSDIREQMNNNADALNGTQGNNHQPDEENALLLPINNENKIPCTDSKIVAGDADTGCVTPDSNLECLKEMAHINGSSLSLCKNSTGTLNTQEVMHPLARVHIPQENSDICQHKRIPSPDMSSSENQHGAPRNQILQPEPPHTTHGCLCSGYPLVHEQNRLHGPNGFVTTTRNDAVYFGSKSENNPDCLSRPIHGREERSPLFYSDNMDQFIQYNQYQNQNKLPTDFYHQINCSGTENCNSPLCHSFSKECDQLIHKHPFNLQIYTRESVYGYGSGNLKFKAFDPPVKDRMEANKEDTAEMKSTNTEDAHLKNLNTVTELNVREGPCATKVDKPSVHSLSLVLREEDCIPASVSWLPPDDDGDCDISESFPQLMEEMKKINKNK